MTDIYRLYNYATEQSDALEAIPTTDEEMVKYIPQEEEVQGLYDLYRQMGQGVQEAMLSVQLKIVEANERRKQP